MICDYNLLLIYLSVRFSNAAPLWSLEPVNQFNLTGLHCRNRQNVLNRVSTSDCGWNILFSCLKLSADKLIHGEESDSSSARVRWRWFFKNKHTLKKVSALLPFLSIIMSQWIFLNVCVYTKTKVERLCEDLSQLSVTVWEEVQKNSSLVEELDWSSNQVSLDWKFH